MKNYTLCLLAAFLVIAGLPAGAQTITTVAGNGVGIYSGDGGKAVAASLHWPQALAFDKSGRMYIADALNHCIRRVSLSGDITTIAGTGFKAGSGIGNYNGDGIPATAADLSSPGGVAIDTMGNVYIADMNNNRIRKVDTSGIIHTIAGDGTQGYGGDNTPATSAQLNRPSRVAADTFGNIYIADPFNNRIRKVSAAGIITTFAGTGVPTYTGDGAQASDATLMSPVDIAVDKKGNVYIADELNECIRKVGVDGVITTIAGDGISSNTGDGGPATAARLYDPAGIALDDSDNIYISEKGNESIRKISQYSGNIAILAGAGMPDSAGYRGDGGPATAGWFDYPQGIIVNSKGTIFIADQNNNRIRAILPVTEGVRTINTVAASIDIYPNPGQGLFIVNIASAINEPAVITISNVAGEQVYRCGMYTNKKKAITPGIEPGIYLLSAATAHGIWTSRLVVD